MVVQVTKTDIKRHVRHDELKSCVGFGLVRAAREQGVLLDGPVRVGYDCVQVGDHTLHLPKRATDALYALDAGFPEYVKPFSFEVQQ